ncbi:hypothetical protein E2C01_044774 [Portunus trituberculatus]|uniref:Uncharacterized protein n=1 Tax=Portunus trituberculatus TaxID=210409 RepID=A0A5B7FSZ8_PORTR|nr:hypothetical protein [Portunus trituberculatus]
MSKLDEDLNKLRSCAPVTPSSQPCHLSGNKGAHPRRRQKQHQQQQEHKSNSSGRKNLQENMNNFLKQ